MDEAKNGGERVHAGVDGLKFGGAEETELETESLGVLAEPDALAIEILTIG